MNVQAEAARDAFHAVMVANKAAVGLEHIATTWAGAVAAVVPLAV